MGKLNDKLIQSAKPRENDYKLTDGDGLTLVVRVNGSKLWQLRYRIDGKAKTYSLGKYPLITLARAREKTFEARRLLAEGGDPMEEKKQIKAAAALASQPTETVEMVAREWFMKFSSGWVESHASKILRRLERDLFPLLGNQPIEDIAPPALLKALRKVESRGALETAHRLLQNCGQVWRYAVATSRAERDITQDLKGALPPTRETHLGSLTNPKDISCLLSNIDEYQGSEVVKAALQLAPLFFVRPGELRQAEWAEFDFKNDLWIIPKGKMKAKRTHVVPLSKQAVNILKNLHQYSGDCELLFPSPRSRSRCLSNVALLAGLRRMGYTKDEMTAHGFRAMASTNLEHLGFDSRLIEIQLAHADKDSVRAAYKRDTHLLRLEERRAMMQAWADYLDKLKENKAE